MKSFSEVEGIFDRYLADSSNFRDEAIADDDDDVSRMTCEAAA